MKNSASPLAAPRAIVFDVIAILVFALLARMNHGGLSFGSVITTSLPFLAGVAVIWGGMALRAATTTSRETARAPLAPAGWMVWLSTLVIGLGIWSIMEGRLPHYTFVIVATIMTAVLLLGWRFLAAKFAR